MQCPSIISYSADVPCPGPLPASDLFNHVCNLCVFSYPDVLFGVLVCDVNILLSICVCATAGLLVAWLVSAFPRGISLLHRLT